MIYFYTSFQRFRIYGLLKTCSENDTMVTAIALPVLLDRQAKTESAQLQIRVGIHIIFFLFLH